MLKTRLMIASTRTINNKHAKQHSTYGVTDTESTVGVA